jgi:hypothetical protein
MKKIIAAVAAVLLGLGVLTGCGSARTDNRTD